MLKYEFYYKLGMLSERYKHEDAKLKILREIYDIFVNYEELPHYFTKLQSLRQFPEETVDSLMGELNYYYSSATGTFLLGGNYRKM